MHLNSESEAWIKAVGKDPAYTADAVKRRILLAGEFMKLGGMAQNEICSALRGIDFARPVAVCALPKKLYVQYVDRYRGNWVTDVGLREDAVGLAQGKRQRILVRPKGSVRALRSRAKAIVDTWTAAREEVVKDFRAKREFDGSIKAGMMTSGGGTQYFLIRREKMEVVSR